MVMTYPRYCSVGVILEEIALQCEALSVCVRER